MRRLPIFPTLLVALAVATMIGLGVWQLRRAAWKEGVLADLQRAAAAPPLLIDNGRLPTDLAFRRARLRLICPDQAYDARAGRDAQGRTGWVWGATCRTGGGEQVRAVLGWNTEASYSGRWRAPRETLAMGTLLPADAAARARFYLDQPPAGLATAAPPSIDSVPNSHRGYAGQWFFFAAAASVIYTLAVRRRA
jgi:surfeit locus 1 family protein